MATYVNDLRLKEIATGDESGTWGTSTNTNLELIGEALGYATQQVFSSDADATTTVADGASDPARAMYFKITSAGNLTATRTCTIAPNTVSRVMFIENATSGSQSIAISQGSGANVTIATGKTAVVYLDGAGSGAAVVDAMAGVDPGVTDTLAEVLTAGNTTTTDQKIQFRDSAIYINSSADGQLDLVADTEIQIAATTVDLNGNLDVSGTTVSAGKITADAGIDIDNINIDGTTIALSSGDLTLDAAGDIILDADGANIIFKNGGTEFGQIITNATPNDLVIRSSISDEDMIFQGNDGGSIITALTLDMSAAGAATFNAGITTGGNVVVGGTLSANSLTIDDITINSSTISDAGNLTIDAGGDIILDADGTQVYIKDGGTERFRFELDATPELVTTGGNFRLRNDTSDADILFIGNDGGSTITALTLDMSAAGRATFNNNAVVTDGNAFVAGNSDDFQIYHSSDQNVIQAVTSDQDIIFKGSDGGSTITALTIDMSDAGAATFNGHGTFNDTVTINSTSNNALAIAGANGGLNFTGGGNRVYFTSNRALEGATDGSTLTVGEGFTTTRLSQAVVANEAGNNRDFRVESAGNANMLFVNGGDDCVNIASAAVKQSVAGLNARVNGASIEFGHTNNSAGYFGTLGAQGNNGHPYLGFSTSAELNVNTFRTYGAAGNIIVGDLSGNLLFSQVVTASAVNQTPVERMRIQQGSLVINEPGNNYDFRVESDNSSAMLFVDASADRVGVGVAAPTHTFDVQSSSTNAVRIRGSANVPLYSYGDGGGVGWATGPTTNYGELIYLDTTNDKISLYTAGVQRFVVGADATVFNESGANTDFRIESDGQANAFVVDGQYNYVTFGKATDGLNLAGGGFSNLQAGGHVYFHVTNTETNSSNSAMYINRQSSDGQLIQFRQANSDEGNISVSGATVSYNGFAGRHESSGVASSTAKGTVVSTIDELDTYLSGPKQGQTRADHAKVKMSDTVGDARVYGVVDNFTDEGKVNVISVGIGSIKVTGACAGGDLLESNGDGTAKVQTDDIIRSKTIGKVTIGDSNTGVKLVSCVLYCG